MNAARVGQSHRILSNKWPHHKMAPSLGSSPRRGLPWQAWHSHLVSRLKRQHMSRQEAIRIKRSPVGKLGQIEKRMVNYRQQG